MKKYILLLTFFVFYLPIQAQTYVQENFDTGIPATWTITDEGDATGDSWASGLQGGGNSLNGSNVAFVDSDANGNGTLMIETLTSPVFDASAAVALFLDFDQYYNNGGGDSAVVEVFDGTSWVPVLTQTADTGGFNNPNEQHIDITAYQNANMQIRFVYNDGDIWAWYWLLDNVQVYNSTCNNPSDLGATVDATNVDLSWTPGGTETSWEIINQTAGGPVPTDSDSGTATTDNPFPINGLTEGTNYEFYVRANCDANGFSIWAGPFAYRIGGPGETCENPIIINNTLPYTTNDDTANYLDDYAGAPGTDCGSGFNYLNGDDVVYAYTPDADTSVDISLTNIAANYAGIFVYTDCANIGNACETGATNGFSTADLIIDNFTVSAGTTYYIVISTWAAPQSVAYTLNITENTCIDPDANISVRQDCENGPQFFIDVDLTDLGSATSVTITDNQASTPIVTSATGLYSFGPFPNGTAIVVTVANDDDANCVISSSSLTQEICTDFIVDCTVGPQNLVYCYENNDTNVFTFTSNDGTPLNFVINAGQVENGWDELHIYDTDGTELTPPNFYGNGGDVSGVSYQSTGDTISFTVTSDGVFSCQTNGYIPIDVTVSCATCVNPIASYAVTSDCINGPQFFVDVDLTDLGSASSVTLTDNQGSAPQNTTTTGIYTFGPFANNTPVVISIANDDDGNCSISSSSLTQEFCIDTIVDCSGGPIDVFYCYGNNETNVFSYTSSDGSPLNLTINTGEIEGAPFDFLVVLDTDGVTELYNGEGNNGDISGLTFQSTGDTIYFSITSDGSVSCASGSFCCSAGIDYTISCATCINPAATYQVVDDCDNGDQFLIDVNVTSLGDATSLTISNNIDANTTSATATGIYQVGPFPFGVDVIITINNDQDVNCVINSSAIQLLACPPENDNPCNAIVVPVNEDDTCTLFASATLLEATDSGVPDTACGGDADDDVWFEFTALSEFQIILIENINGTGFANLDHAVYEGTCDGLTELYCSDASASITPSLTVGNTYFVRVFSFGGANTDFTFDLCIRPGSGNVSVDQTTYTVEQLVTDILIDSPCAQISNITYSTGTDFGEVNGIGYFSAFDGGFPFEEGILLTSGNAAEASGPNINAMSDGTFGWPGDADLDSEVGINSNNASIIEFDFVPLSDEISFDFLMASEEYNGSTGGTFECTYSDAFAFLLTDQNGITTNLAVLPGTQTPILVTNIHPENPGCPAINEEYFGGYTPQNLPPISFDGRTNVFTAFSTVNIGETYHIKLVMADATDAALDSGVFLKAGSFDIGEVELGDDITVEAGTAVCDGEPIIIQTQATSVEHVWYKDGFVIDGETNYILEVTEPGEYFVQIIFSPSCIIEDSINIEFLSKPIANTPPDLIGCASGASETAEYILEDSDLAILGDTQSPIDFTVTYYLTEQDAIDDVNALVSPYTNETNPQTLYARVTNNSTLCYDTTSLNLSLGTLPITNFTSDFDYEVCPNATVPIIIEATPENYSTSDVTINWYLDGGLILGENGLTIPVLLAGTYEIEVIFNDTGCSSITTQEVIELESCVIPQGISPNGDGMNDTFDLSSYNVSKLEIFNRNGTLVYSKTNYTNEWHGQTNDGEELPVGTYFYTMEYENGKQRSAWVYIQRLN
jgi:gliding motility-associated-like protein